MSLNSYNIYFAGEIQGENMDRIKSDFCKKFDYDKDIDFIFSGEKVVLIRDLDQIKAADYLEIFEQIGMICHIEVADPKAIIDETSLIIDSNQPSFLFRLVNSNIFLLSLLSLIIIIPFAVNNITIVMVSSLLLCIILCHVVFMQRCTDNQIFPHDFWSINRITGSIIAIVYLCISVNISRILPRFDIYSYSSGEFSKSLLKLYIFGFVYIIFLPILGILSMLYYDIIYTPENEMLRKGADVASIIVGFYFIALSVFIFLAFL
jgi:hypothetical protein